MNHMFNENIAVKYGVDGAIMIHNLHFWIKKNIASKKHSYDGRYWTYNSAESFSKLFKYWSNRQIERILKNLEKDGAIITGNYNKSKYDRTKWYSLSDDVYSIYSKGETDLRDHVNVFTQTVEPIPDSKPDNKTNNNTRKALDNDLLENEFQKFWKIYDKPNDRKKCFAKWKRLKANDKSKVFETLPAYIKSKPDKQYRKNPLSWLNGECWNDEIQQQAQPEQPQDLSAFYDVPPEL